MKARDQSLGWQARLPLCSKTKSISALSPPSTCDFPCLSWRLGGLQGQSHVLTVDGLERGLLEVAKTDALGLGRTAEIIYVVSHLNLISVLSYLSNYQSLI